MNAPEYCFLSINWWPLCMDKGQWATWVQAVFSVVAIAAAIWIGHRTDVKARSGARNYFAVFTESARNAVGATLQAAQNKDLVGFRIGRAMILDAIQLGQGVPLHLLSERNALNAVRYRSVLSTAGASVANDPTEAFVGMDFTYAATSLAYVLEELQAEREPTRADKPEKTN